KPIPGAPVVTTMVAYKVGSADEALSATGLSHYLEHLMFKGTDKLMPGDIDKLTMRSGGRNNANTSEACTVYHFRFAADRRATAEVIKSDYDKWYRPNNAALVVVGGFDPDKALARIKELFGPSPAGKLPERKTATPARRDKPVRTEIPSKFEVPRVVMGFNG